MTDLWMSAATFQRGTTFKVWFIALVYLDLVLTLAATHAGFMELNPVMDWMLANPVQLILVKVVVPPVLAWLAPGRLLMPSVVFAAGITLWNVRVLFTAL